MNLFDSKEKALEYINLCKNYDPSFIINLIKKYLPKNSSILELGLGSGIDFRELKKFYNAILQTILKVL